MHEGHTLNKTSKGSKILLKQESLGIHTYDKVDPQSNKVEMG